MTAHAPAGWEPAPRLAMQHALEDAAAEATDAQDRLIALLVTGLDTGELTADSVEEALAQVQATRAAFVEATRGALGSLNAEVRDIRLTLGEADSTRGS